MAYKNKILIGLFVTTTIFGGIAHAQGTLPGNTGKNYTLLAPLPAISNDGSRPSGECISDAGSGIPMLKCVDMGSFFQYLFNLFIAMAAVSAVFMIVYGGFLYVSTSSATQKLSGKKYFWNAIGGLLIILFAFLFLRTVNPKLVEIPQAIPTIQPAVTASNPLDFINQMIEEAQKYNALGQDDINNAKKAQAEAQVLLQQREKLAFELASELNSENPSKKNDPAYVQSLINDINGLDQRIKKLQATVTLDTGSSLMNNGSNAQSLQNIATNQGLFSAIGEKTIDEEVQSGLKYIDSVAMDRNKQLTKMQSYEDIVRAGGLNESAEAAKISLELEGIKAKVSLARTDTIPGGLFSTKKVVKIGNDVNSIGTIAQAKSGFNEEIAALDARIAAIVDPDLKTRTQVLSAQVKAQVESKIK